MAPEGQSAEGQIGQQTLIYAILMQAPAVVLLTL